MSLDRFKSAQKDSYETALKEIRSGRKKTHWMWYIFPQIHGLGHSSTAKYYELQSREEAAEYLRDPLLGARLRKITQVLLDQQSRDAEAIFGYPDDVKLLSSMTLFEAVDPSCTLFQEVIDAFYSGKRDERTLEILKREKE